MGLGDMLLGVELVRGEGANGVDGRSLRIEGWVVGLTGGASGVQRNSPKVSQQIPVESSLTSTSHP